MGCISRLFFFSYIWGFFSQPFTNQEVQKGNIGLKWVSHYSLTTKERKLLVVSSSMITAGQLVEYSISCVQNFFSRVFNEYNIFYCGYFEGQRFFFIGQNVFLWAFRGSKICFRGYFVRPNFSLVSISWLTRKYISEEHE